jgi:hypothetical protein
MTKPATKRPKPKTPRGRRGVKPNASNPNQGTTDAFEREDMGVAPKE